MQELLASHVLFTGRMTTIDLEHVVGGIFYGETKSPTGERWAANLDAKAKALVDATPVGKNALGVAMIPFLGVGEWVARKAGATYDLLGGAS
jgi:hypothetical protein